MIFLAKSDGTVVAFSGSNVNQGSVGVNDLYLFAPFIATAAVYASFRLPNGILLTPRLVLGADGESLDAKPLYGDIPYGYKLAPVDGFDGAFTDTDGNVYNLWHITMDAPLTQFSGALSVQFFVVVGINVTALSACRVTINDGVPYLDPYITSADINNISGWLSAAEVSATKAKESEDAAEVSARIATEAAKDIRMLTGKLFSFEFNASEDAYYLTGFNTEEFTEEELEAVSFIDIPESYAGKRVVGIGTNAFRLRDHITGVSIPDTIISIGESAFHSTSLTNVNIPESVLTIGSEAFANLSNLSYIYLNSIDTSRFPGDMLSDSYVGTIYLPWKAGTAGDTSPFGAMEVSMEIYGYSPVMLRDLPQLIAVKVDKPDLASDANYTLVAINGKGEVIARDYSNQAIGNTIVQRTGGGGAKFVAQYGAAENVANLAALQMAQSMAYIDSYSGSTTSHKYKPYVFAAKGWGQGSSVENAEITDFPNAVGDEWYQKICNGADVDKTIILRSALMTNSSRKTTLNCVQKFTNNVRFGNQEWEPGLHDLTLVVSSNSTIEIRCRYQSTGYSQIWIT